MQVDGLAVVAGILVLATVVEALVEHFVTPLVEPLRTKAEDPLTEPTRSETLSGWRMMLLRYLSAGLGIALCIIYDADVLVLLGVSTDIPIVGSVLTGFLIGRGSNFIHQFASTWLVKREA